MYHTEFQRPSMELYTEIGILSDQNEKKIFVSLMLVYLIFK